VAGTTKSTVYIKLHIFIRQSPRRPAQRVYRGVCIIQTGQIFHLTTHISLRVTAGTAALAALPFWCESGCTCFNSIYCS